MKTTAVRVTAEHINRGKPGNACNCAFALAVIDALDNDAITIASVWVGSIGPGDRLRVDATLADDGTYTAPLDEATERWISEFDAGVKVEPIEVTLTWEAYS